MEIKVNLLKIWWKKSSFFPFIFCRAYIFSKTVYCISNNWQNRQAVYFDTTSHILCVRMQVVFLEVQFWEMSLYSLFLIFFEYDRLMKMQTFFLWKNALKSVRNNMNIRNNLGKKNSFLCQLQLPISQNRSVQLVPHFVGGHHICDFDYQLSLLLKVGWTWLQPPLPLPPCWPWPKRALYVLLIYKLVWRENGKINTNTCMYFTVYKLIRVSYKPYWGEKC